MNNTSKTTIQGCPSSPDLLLKLISTKSRKNHRQHIKSPNKCIVENTSKTTIKSFNTSFSIFPSVTEQKILRTVKGYVKRLYTGIYISVSSLISH